MQLLGGGNRIYIVHAQISMCRKPNHDMQICILAQKKYVQVLDGFW